MSEARYDAVVVGGGVIGLACAWRAAQRGLRVAVLERGQAGRGATHVAGGILWPRAELGGAVLHRLGSASAERYPAFAAELEAETGIGVEYVRSGALAVALADDELALAAEHAGPDFLAGDECRRLVPRLSADCVGGFLAEDAAQVDPRPLAAALVEALGRAGGELHEGVEATATVVEGGRVAGVACANATFRAPAVVLAAGAWAGAAPALANGAPPPVRPVKGQILRLRTPEAGSGPIVRTRSVYVVVRPSGEVVVGATVEERGFDVSVTAEGVRFLLDEALEAVPGLAGLELVEASAGLRPGTPDDAPLIGESGTEGLLVASGHFRNGVLLAPITAEAIAALLVGERPPPEVEPFAPTRFE